MSVLHHVYDIPSEDELAMLVGAATPHFALQARNRVAGYLERLPQDHPRRPELQRHLARLETLATQGETAGRVPNLPARPSLPGAGGGAAH